MNSADILGLPRGFKFAAGGAILMVLGLLLPWVTFSVAGLTVISYSGYSLYLLALVILAAAAASLYFTYQYMQKKFVTIQDSYGNLGLGAVSFILIIIGYLVTSVPGAGLLSGYIDIPKSPALGLFISLIGAILMAVGGYFNMKQSAQPVTPTYPRPQV